jgi:2-dehydro-3-deoxyphosphogluconate aldolase/(4S)-4-hydroxy-2-oxoglutarate aldolase
MNLVTELSRARILSAAVIDDPAHAVPLARALLAGGLGIMEVTFRNAHAAECIRRIRHEVPAMTVGAGTLLTPVQIDEAIKAGAQFGVSPGFNPTVVRHSVAAGFPFAPGVLTPGEMEQSLELGCPVMKFFPAAAAGGADFIKAIAAPYAHTALRLVPLGGIGESNLGDYLALPIVIAVGGSWLTDRKLAAAGKWDEISGLTQRAVHLTTHFLKPEL